MPELKDFSWGSGVAAVPPKTLRDSNSEDVDNTRGNNEHMHDMVAANYLILGVENGRFRGAYVAFPGRRNFDTVTNMFLGRYGEPDKSGSAPDNHYWTGTDLNIRLYYQADTDEGILALSCQE